MQSLQRVCRAFAERISYGERSGLQSYRAAERGSRRGRPAGQPRVIAERLQSVCRAILVWRQVRLQSCRATERGSGGGPAARPRGRRPRVITERLQSVCRARFVWRQVRVQSYRAAERDRGGVAGQIAEGYREPGPRSVPVRSRLQRVCRGPLQSCSRYPPRWCLLGLPVPLDNNDFWVGLPLSSLHTYQT